MFPITYTETVRNFGTVDPTRDLPVGQRLMDRHGNRYIHRADGDWDRLPEPAINRPGSVICNEYIRSMLSNRRMTTAQPALSL